MIALEYSEFIKTKASRHEPSGFNVVENKLNPMLFDWQKKLVAISLSRGRNALFEDCGLGKTFQSLEWSKFVSDKTDAPVLILAPLAVSHQTKREGDKFGVLVNICRDGDDVVPGVNITNYEKLDNFDPSVFSGIVLDESSILKNFSGKIRNKIIESFSQTPYKLCCTATPAPNDYTELGNTAEFLGVMTRSEMLSMFFINNTGDTTANWRLKGHVRDNIFWEWVSSWAVMIQKPSDIGFEDGDFILPQLNIQDVVLPHTGERHTLFVEPATTLTDRRNARKESLEERVLKTSRIINQSDDIWIAWCNLNAESDALRSAIRGSVEVRGSDTQEHKERSMLDFADGKIKCLVSKPSIAGMGMNFQSCSNMAFVGLSDSFEQYYQSVRRCWRFGQKKQVNAYIVTGEKEGNVVSNIKRKEHDMKKMFAGIRHHMARVVGNKQSSLLIKTTDYKPKKHIEIPDFLEVAL